MQHFANLVRPRERSPRHRTRGDRSARDGGRRRCWLLANQRLYRLLSAKAVAVRPLRGLPRAGARPGDFSFQDFPQNFELIS